MKLLAPGDWTVTVEGTTTTGDLEPLTSTFVVADGVTVTTQPNADLGPTTTVATNSVPADPNGAWYTSGVRLGTPALTTRGFGAEEFDRVAELMVEVLSNTTPGTTKAGTPSQASYVLADGVADRVRAASAEMLDKHPLYPGIDLS